MWQEEPIHTVIFILVNPFRIKIFMFRFSARGGFFFFGFSFRLSSRLAYPLRCPRTPRCGSRQRSGSSGAHTLPPFCFSRRKAKDTCPRPFRLRQGETSDMYFAASAAALPCVACDQSRMYGSPSSEISTFEGLKSPWHTLLCFGIA